MRITQSRTLNSRQIILLWTISTENFSILEKNTWKIMFWSPARRPPAPRSATGPGLSASWLSWQSRSSSGLERCQTLTLQMMRDRHTFRNNNQNPVKRAGTEAGPLTEMCYNQTLKCNWTTESLKSMNPAACVVLLFFLKVWDLCLFSTRFDVFMIEIWDLRVWATNIWNSSGNCAVLPPAHSLVLAADFI